MKDGEKIATVKDLSGKNNDLTAPADKQPTFKENLQAVSRHSLSATAISTSNRL